MPPMIGLRPLGGSLPPSACYDPRRPMALQVLQRPDWDGTPRELGHLFRVYKDRGGKRLAALGILLSHQLGWEVRLEVNGDLQRSVVCRTQDEVLTTGEEWRDAMIAHGWSTEARG